MADAKTLQDLGYGEILSALAARCSTPIGKERALGRTFSPSFTDIERHHQLIGEALELRRREVNLSLRDISDIRPSLDAVEKAALLEPRAFVTIARALRSMVLLRSLLDDWKAQAPGLNALGERIPIFEDLARQLEVSFDANGEIADRASPELRAARDRCRGLHRNIKSQLDELMRDEKFAVHLRENYFSVRNDRYVLPVLSANRAEVPGIVHNASQSGQTLFIEPEAVISLGNDLTIAQSVVLEEERRILERLGLEIAHRSEELRAGLDAAAELDEVNAAAILSDDMHASAASLSENASLKLYSLRHPRLLLRGISVVPNDVELTEPVRGLVISGPNAGGKTITLTGVALCTLMFRAGLHVPAGPGSKIPWYRSIDAIVGEGQDLNEGLSSFSAHVGRLRQIEAQVQSASLVLIDEIAADTDPREGASLAIAYLIDLVDRGAHAVVTTHLEEVKALAHLDGRFQNARVGFDSVKMAPTYRLQQGLAGTSSAIEIAERAGMPERICRRARELTAGAGGALAQALSVVELERRQVEAESAKARAAQEQATREREDLLRLRKEMELRRDTDELRHRESLASELERATAEVRGLAQELRAKESAAAAARAQKELAQQLEEARRRAEETRARLAPAEPKDAPAALRVGGWAKHRTLKQRVEILELDDHDALVAAGAIKMRVPTAELVGVQSTTQNRFPAKSERQAEALARASAAAPAGIAESRQCDIRGLRAEEALRQVESFLDVYFREGADEAVILHGHGTGALKQVVRDYLDRSPYVRMFRPGDTGEGGDGVTIVAFRS